MAAELWSAPWTVSHRVLGVWLSGVFSSTGTPSRHCVTRSSARSNPGDHPASNAAVRCPTPRPEPRRTPSSFPESGSRTKFHRSLPQISYQAKRYLQNSFPNCFRLEVCRSIPLSLKPPLQICYRVAAENLYFSSFVRVFFTTGQRMKCR